MIGHCCTAINYLNLNSKRYPCYNDNMAKKSIQRTKAKGHGHLLASSLLLIGVTAVGNMTTTREQPGWRTRRMVFLSLFFALLILNAPESAAPKQQPWYRKKLFFWEHKRIAHFLCRKWNIPKTKTQSKAKCSLLYMHLQKYFFGDLWEATCPPAPSHKHQLL